MHTLKSRLQRLSAGRVNGLLTSESEQLVLVAVAALSALRRLVGELVGLVLRTGQSALSVFTSVGNLCNLSM